MKTRVGEEGIGLEYLVFMIRVNKKYHQINSGIKILYPVTAGSSNAIRYAVTHLRQGDMVFGFFLDGQGDENPCNHGSDGNTAQTIGSTEIGTNRVTNKQPGSLAISGYAIEKRPKDPGTGEKKTPPDSDLSAVRPGAPPETAPIPQGVKLNKYGLRLDLTRTPEQYSR